MSMWLNCLVAVVYMYVFTMEPEVSAVQGS